ncbi:MAG: YafY family protein [Breznakibacter sp.]
MNRFDRVASILIVLQTKRFVTAEELARRFGVSKRTVYRDLATLGAAGLPLGAEPGKGYFLAEGYHLPPVMFTRNEAAALLMGAKMLEKLSDQSVNHSFVSAFDKIKAVLPGSEKEWLSRLENGIEVYHHAERFHADCPNVYLTAIQQALSQQKILEIGYRTFSRDDELTVRHIEPIGLCFYSMHWHLVAWCRMRNGYRDFRTDRIVSVQDTGQTFDSRKGKSMRDYFASMQRLEAPLEASVTVDFRTASMMETSRSYYGFLESEICPSGMCMHFVTSDYGYLARWLMMFADGLIDLKPNALAGELAKLANASKFFGPSQHLLT